MGNIHRRKLKETKNRNERKNGKIERRIALGFSPGQVIWITGASSGIGEEVAYQFASLGSKLALSGTRIDALEKVRKRCLEKGSPKAECVPFDVADHWAHAGVLEKILNDFGERTLGAKADLGQNFFEPLLTCISTSLHTGSSPRLAVFRFMVSSSRA